MKNIYEICAAITEHRKIAEIVNKAGGISETTETSDKLGYLFKIYKVGDKEIMREYIKNPDYEEPVNDYIGDGTDFNPYKYWSEGKEVIAGKWYQTEDDYLWEAIKDGVPNSSTDKEYFDVIE